MSRNVRIALLAALLVLAVAALASVIAEEVVHPCPTEAEQCGRLCAGQTRPRLPWRCTAASCNCPPAIRWPRGLRGH